VKSRSNKCSHNNWTFT